MQKKWENIEELEPLIVKYFDDCDSEKRPYTVTGLACALETTRKTLMEYQVKDEFSKLLVGAKAKCENYAEEKLYTGSNVAGVIFSMKNNYGWTDKIDLGGAVDLGIGELTDAELDAKIKEKQDKINALEEK